MSIVVIVPALWDYEVISALRKLWTHHLLSREAAEEGLMRLYRLPIQKIVVAQVQSISALRWAERLGQRVACDAQYLSLAEELKAPFYTSDKKLFKRCQEFEIDFIFLLE